MSGLRLHAILAYMGPMRRLSLAIAATLLLPVIASASAYSAPQMELAEADRAEIEALYKAWERGWNTHDAAAWAGLFHEDGTWVLWNGGTWKGRATIAAGMREAFATVYASSTQTWRAPPELRLVAPGVVVGRAISTTTGDSRQPGVTIHGNKMLVLTRQDGKWGILYGQNSRLTDAEIAKLK